MISSLINYHQKFLTPAGELAPKYLYDVPARHKMKTSTAIPQIWEHILLPLDRRAVNAESVSLTSVTSNSFLPEAFNSGV